MKYFKLLLCLILTVSFIVPASVVHADDEFVINGGVLELYTGNATSVVIPEGVTSILANAFSNDEYLFHVTIESETCSFENGAFPFNVTVHAYEGSRAASDAKNYGYNVSYLEKKQYTITINYVYSNGSQALSPVTLTCEPGESFSVGSPVIENYNPDIAEVSGTATEDKTYTVVYNSSPDGWIKTDTGIKYRSDGAFVSGTSKDIDGVTYNFDTSGYLTTSGMFFSISGSTYYVLGNSFVTGYKAIGSYIYYFDSTGAMAVSTGVDSYSFDEYGRMIGDNMMVTLQNKTFYLVGNRLYSGFCLIGDKIHVFGSDYFMITNSSYDGISFDADGNLKSGLSIEKLSISQIADVSYNGEEQEPQLTVKFNNLVLSEGQYYTVEYDNNVEPGTASVKIKGIGGVEGEKTLSFNILSEDTCTLTVRFVDAMGNKVADDFVTEVEPGSEYSIIAPEVEGMTPDRELIEGTMGLTDLTIVVLYSDAKEDSETETEVSDTETEEPTDTETEQTETKKKPVETEIVIENDTKPVYDYTIMIVIFIVASVVCGLAVVTIINWDAIKKGLKKKFGKNK